MTAPLLIPAGFVGTSEMREFLGRHHDELRLSPLLAPPTIDRDAFVNEHDQFNHDRCTVVAVGCKNGSRPRPVIGFATLRIVDHAALCHRAELGAGVLAGHRGYGIGRALIRAAIAHACSLPKLRWVDGIALESNSAVLKIDQEEGFRVRSVVPDFVRVDGRSIGLVQMSIDLDEMRSAK